MPFLTSTRITDQESDPLVAFYDRMAVLLFSTRQSMVVCNKISSDETWLIRTMFLLKKVKILKSQFKRNFKMN